VGKYDRWIARKSVERGLNGMVVNKHNDKTYFIIQGFPWRVGGAIPQPNPCVGGALLWSWDRKTLKKVLPLTVSPRVACQISDMG